MTTIIQNTIEMACTPEVLFAYVTQPWRWHEWHPNSQSAEAVKDVLAVGDGFDEVVALQPLSPLPLTLKRKTKYQVLKSDTGQCWIVRGEMKDAWLEIRYDFEPSNTGTLFKRTLKYNARGLTRLGMPFLAPRMKTMSLVALGNLQAKVESGDLS